MFIQMAEILDTVEVECLRAVESLLEPTALQ